MRRQFTLDYWLDDGWYVGRLREVPGVFSQGESLDELERNIRDAFRLVIEDAQEPAHEEALAQLKSRVRQQRKLSKSEIRANLNASLTENEQDRLSLLLVPTMPTFCQSLMKTLLGRKESVHKRSRLR